MSGTKSGSVKAVAKVLAKDPDHFKRIGALGGKKQVPKGFAMNPALASTAGAKGGAISKRRKAVK